MADIHLDLEALADMSRDLLAIRDEFEHAEEIGDQVGAWTGHPGLEHTVHDFADKWSIHRRKMLEKLEWISSAVQAIHDTMLETDEKLAESLTILPSMPPKD